VSSVEGRCDIEKKMAFNLLNRDPSKEMHSTFSTPDTPTLLELIVLAQN
jgi:hypothetical protein